MSDHTEHTPNQPAKPESSPKGATAAKPDPYAGHNMGKSDKQGAQQKGAEKK